jgi:hypothetical protein
MHEGAAGPVEAISFGDGVVLLDEPNQRLFAANGTAAIVWNLLAAGYDPPSIIKTLAEGFGVTLSMIAPEVTALIGGWRTDGLLSGGPPAQRSRYATDFATEHDLGGPAQSFQCVIVGKRTRLHLAEAAVAAHVAGVLQPFLVDEGGGFDHAIDLAVEGGSEPLVLRVDGVERMRLSSAAEAIGAVFQQLLALARPGIEWLAAIHGAAVVSPDGRAVLLPGAGGSGKSTLAAYLSRRGWRFLSDDMIALTAPYGAVVAWPTPHSIKSGSWAALADWIPELEASPVAMIYDRAIKFVAADSDGWVQPPMPVSGILFPRWSAIPARAGVRLSALDALVRLLNDRVWLGYPLTRSRVEAFLAWLGSVPICASITYHTLAEAEALLENMLG